MSNLIRLRYNTIAHETPRGELKWRVILERSDGSFEEVLVKDLFINVPSFSREDEMPVVGRKYHMPATASSASRTASAMWIRSKGTAGNFAHCNYRRADRLFQIRT